METDELKRNILGITERIARAAAVSGQNVTLVAATKTVPADVINSAIGLGITDVGENRVQEYNAKKDAVSGAEWHFIGTLQRNKAKYIVGSVALIQSVNSAELARVIDGLAAKRNVMQDVLIEVNAASEPDKTGAPIERFDELYEFCRSLGSLRVRGLMAVPPKGANDGVYVRLRDVFDRYESDTFDTLSVGMSGDYERAIACGSNMVRIGTALFGHRIR